ncbi:MAG: SpoIIE family protein phosphatase [Firmicutes bacterium]|nr:SpoIIE family protein phosphatase [Bacillota bacterium]
MEECRYCRLLDRLIDVFVCYQIPVDDEGRPRGLVLLDFNPAFEKMMGIKKGELVRGDMITEMPEEFTRFGFDWFSTPVNLTEMDEPLRSEYYSKHLNCWYEISICRDEGGCFAAIFRDISGRKQAEDSRKKTLYFLTALLDNIPNCYAMILKKHTREIIASNKAAQETGAVPGEICYKTFGKRDDRCPFCRAPELWASGRTQHTEVRYRGTWYEGIWAPFSEDLYVHYIIDIDEHKVAEQKIANYTLELEHLYYRLEGEMEKVREMHKKTLLPRLPEIKGYSLAAHYQPARRLGGDFYDAIKVGRKLILYLSDVSGHGPEGVLLSTFVKEAINSYINLKPDEIHPEKIMRHLHRQYRRGNYPEDYFICIFLAVIDLLTMELSYIGAGLQAFPLVQMGGGERLQLISRGLPISNAVPAGLMNFTTKKIVLQPGTAIFFYTDGLVEQEAGGIHYGMRLPDVFFKNSHLPPEVIIQAVNEDFREFNGGHLLGDDDITSVVLRVGR